MLRGAVILGSSLSITVTLRVFVVVLPEPSVTEYVRIVSPFRKKLPAGIPPVVIAPRPPQLSEADGVSISDARAVAPQLPTSLVAVKSVRSAGIVRTGGVRSKTLT